MVNSLVEFTPWRIFSGVSLDHFLTLVRCKSSHPVGQLLGLGVFFRSMSLNFVVPFRNSHYF